MEQQPETYVFSGRLARVLGVFVVCLVGGSATIGRGSGLDLSGLGVHCNHASSLCIYFGILLAHIVRPILRFCLTCTLCIDSTIICLLIGSHLSSYSLMSPAKLITPSCLSSFLTTHF